MITLRKIFAVIGSLVGVGGLVLGYLQWQYPNTVLFHGRYDMNGIWSFEYQYPVSNGIVHLKGKAHYFSNGKYNVTGTMEIVGGLKKSEIYLKYSMDGAGEWTINDNDLITTLNSFITSPVKSMSNGIENDIYTDAKLLGIILETPQDKMPIGKSQLYEIISSNGDQLELKTDGICGDFSFIINKVK
ncbi:hypothetical protein IBT49_19845 [Erwinia sp. S63]|uniref:hypothetical protein n=1 Tax=Erwinia sp. S63 TaxID=2769341 RepID=UPI00190AC431|nr:hypothetical protein [Erwinia sp. S63]MBK0098243.1 hypothetical protein [Erwinia sp. S63]